MNAFIEALKLRARITLGHDITNEEQLAYALGHLYGALVPSGMATELLLKVERENISLMANKVNA